MDTSDGSELWGPFVWYDMFSWRGMMNMFWDWLLVVLFPISLILAFIRDANGDWSIWQTWGDDPIDKDALIP